MIFSTSFNGSELITIIVNVTQSFLKHLMISTPSQISHVINSGCRQFDVQMQFRVLLAAKISVIAFRGQTSALFFVDKSNEVRSLFVRREGNSMTNAKFFPLAFKSLGLCAYMSCLCVKTGICFDLASSFLV